MASYQGVNLGQLWIQANQAGVSDGLKLNQEDRTQEAWFKKLQDDDKNANEVAAAKARLNGGGDGAGVNPVTGPMADIIASTAKKDGATDTEIATLQRIAMVESGGDPKIKNKLGSGATGLFQFMPRTADQYGLKDSTDPVASTTAALRLMRDNGQQLRNGLKREPTPGELYLAHQQGGGGALRLLANPGGDPFTTLGAKAAGMNGATQGMTNADFTRKWVNAIQLPKDLGAKPTRENAPPAPATPSAEAPAARSVPTTKVPSTKEPMTGQKFSSIDEDPFAPYMTGEADQPTPVPPKQDTASLNTDDIFMQGYKAAFDNYATREPLRYTPSDEEAA